MQSDVANSNATDLGKGPKERVAFLLLDGVELDTFEIFRREGIMPNIDRLLNDGHFRQMQSRDTYSAEATPTEMVTGQSAEATRYFSLLKFNPDTYVSTNIGAHRGPGFYDRPDVKSIVFDVPHMQIDEDTPGIQVAAWGCHSAQFPRSSNPPQVIVDLEQKFGTQHTPEFEDIHSSHNLAWGRAVTDHISESLKTRPKIVEWLMDKEPDWDLMFLGSTESHMHEHAFHHSVDPDHVLYSHPSTPQVLEFMRELFVGIDQMVGEIEDLLPENTTFVIGSVHGAMASAADSSAVLAAELVYRDQTGKKLLDLPLHLDGPIELEQWQRARGYLQRYRLRPGKPSLPGIKEAVMHYVQWFTHRHLAGRPERWMELASRRLKGQTKQWWIVRKHDPLTEPIDVSGPIPPVDVLSEPANWYSDDWPDMRFFVMPGFSGLHIRINLQGREKHGVVKPEDYASACQEVEDLLAPMTDAVTGEPLIQQFLRMRADDPFAPDGPTADVVVVLSASMTIEHPTYGKIGTVPFGRVAEHSNRGWLLAVGDDIKTTGDDLVRPIDVSSTLLALLGRPQQDRCTGKPAFERSTTRT